MNAVVKTPIYDQNLYHLQKEVGVRRENGAFKLTRLKPKHKQAIAMHLDGHKNETICQVLGFTPAWLSTILNDPLSQRIIHCQDGFDRMEFERLRKKANAALRDGLNHENIGVRLRAADLYSKRAGDYHPKTPEHQDSAEDVIQRMLEINADQVNVQVNIGGNSER